MLDLAIMTARLAHDRVAGQFPAAGPRVRKTARRHPAPR